MGPPDCLTFARLRRLVIKSLYSFRVATLTTKDIKGILEKLLPACPVLQELDFKHGLGSDCTRACPSGPSATTLPGVGGCLAHLPPTLKALLLGDFCLEGDAFSCALPPHLVSISLYHCGEHASAIAAALRVSDPQLCIVAAEAQPDA